MGQWTKQDDEFIINNYNEMGYKEIARHLNRSVRVTVDRIQKLRFAGKIDLKRSHKVRCIETGVIYETQQQAEKDLGLSNGMINKYFNGKLKSAGGKHFEKI